MKTMTQFTGSTIKSVKPYLRKVQNASEIHVSDYCPNNRFQKVESAGYKEVMPSEIHRFDFTGKKVWYRRSTSMGRSRIYVAI